MNTPICDFIKAYSEKNVIRAHMPGHKGKSFTGRESSDITEINGADVLYHSESIIKESADNASELFNSGKTLYSTEGSSLSIRAMLYLVMLYAEKNNLKPIIAAGRNAHKSFLTASALLGFDIKWLYPEKLNELLYCEITPKNLDNELSFMEKQGEKPVVVYITSPDYLGNIADIKGISEVCKKHQILFIVDNAHGAYLKFLPKNIHPIALGADMCCDSAHKTLPVLTGGGYLHISKNAPDLFFENAENAMSVFASTSPSYLILESLDKVNSYLFGGYKEKLSDYVKKVSVLKKNIEAYGIPLVGREPLKITIEAKKIGYTGTELAQILYDKNIVCEFSDPDYVVMMLTFENGDEALEIIEKVLTEIPMRQPLEKEFLPVSIPEKALSPRKAMLAAAKNVSIYESRGKILASPVISCPPAVPIAVCGEIIDDNAIRLFEYYGITSCCVIEM